MRTRTAQQEAATQERKARFKELSKKLAALTKEQREALSKAAGRIVTIEGRALSPRNTILCYWQREGVTMVGGFRQWIKAGRCVKKGEHGMSILVPCGAGRKDGDEEATEVRFFVGGTVFDISQTAPLPSEAPDAEPEKTAINTEAQEVIEPEVLPATKPQQNELLLLNA